MKPKIPNQRNRYAKLKGRLNKYALAVQNIYDTLNAEAAKIALQTGYGGDGVFRFSDYPITADAVNRLQGQFVRELRGLIYSGTSAEWKESNLVQDLLASSVLKTYGAQIHGEKTQVYYQTNSDALKAFQERTDRGMNLSAKLWNQSGNYKQELEYAISSAIEKGTSAVTLSKRLSKYLNDFPSLKADYKEKYGEAVSCQDCEYRSVRLARTEINMAYRTAEQKRWSQMDFVVGYEVKLSASHEIDDICDSAQGKYPKDFVFTGWHPNCMCYVIPILKTEEEFWSEDRTTPSVNEVTDVPDGFKTWVQNNEERIAAAEQRGTLPYWYSDNKTLIETYQVDAILNAEAIGMKTNPQDELLQRLDSLLIAKNGGLLPKSVANALMYIEEQITANDFTDAEMRIRWLEAAVERHVNRTPYQKESLQLKWKIRSRKQQKLELEETGEYNDIKLNRKNGGIKATHMHHNLDKRGGIYELNAQDAGFNAGHSVILERERGTIIGMRYTEGTWDGLPFEVAGRETGTVNNVLKGLKHCASKKTTKIAVLDFPKGNFDIDILEQAIRRYRGLEKLNDGQFLKFERIICVQDKKIVYDEIF